MKKILILLIAISALNINAQTGNSFNTYEERSKDIIKSAEASLDDTDKQVIKAFFNIYLDHKKIETSKVLIGFVSYKDINHYSIVTDSFTTFFEPNRTYHMVITHPDYNKQMIRIVTSDEDMKIKVDVYLSSKDPDCYIGYYKYSKTLKKYVQYE